MSNTPQKNSKVLSIILALLVVAALVFGFVNNGSKADLNKQVDELTTKVSTLTAELDSAKASVEAAQAAEEAALAQAEAQRIAAEAKAAEEAAAAAAEEAARAAEEAAAAQAAVEEAAAIGGVLPGFEVARALGLPLFYCEKRDGALILRRGFDLRPGMRVLVVEDEVSTGQSVREMAEIVRALGGEVAGVGCLVDKSGGKAPLDTPLTALITLDAQHYRPEACPMCKAGQPLQNLR